MATVIDRFAGKYAFLSNFYLTSVHYNGVTFPSSEHAYQAQKSTDPAVHKLFATIIRPQEAKRAGGQLSLREDWKQIKLREMYLILRMKFWSEPLRQMLLDTGKADLIEGNWWHDTYWGVCNGTGRKCGGHEPYGENRLGLLLEDVRMMCNEENGLAMLDELGACSSHSGELEL